ncbi:alpha/beta hydrolase-fold protein [Alienimonas chondri]|uniref:alpha/beta hydrolase-fold protein n=1 Tax=Alienimonas chondri TaxID=2681879 RepID=UPI001488D1AC|nr:alpha/beta hydrolase-fold protein [Alienimonas chondri]
MAPGFSLRTYTDEFGAHKYSVFVPRTPPPPAGYPLVLFLHGANERGTDGIAQTKVGLGAIIRNDPDFPAVVVFPQVENPDGRILPAWNPDRPDGARALKIFDEVKQTVSFDPRRQVLTGWSMGGYGVLGQLAKGDPERWSAAVSVASGRANDVDRKALAEASRVTPLWIVAGAQDRFVPFVETAKTVAELREDGGRVRFTKVRNAGHSVWETAFASDRFAAILQNPRVVDPRETNRPPGEVDLTVTDLPDEDEFDRTADAPVAPEAFQPELILSRGAFVRADNALMTKLAQQAAQALPPDTLTGAIPDQNITRDVLGQKIFVNFSGISYAGKISNVAVRGHDGNVVTVRVELVDASVTVRCIRMRAPLGHRGIAGPVTVRAGLRRPLVLEVDIRPTIVQNELKLTALCTRFSLPADDYYVCGPTCIDEDGLFLTESKLAKQLVEGIYEARRQGEQAVRDAVPEMLQEVGGGVSLGNPGGLAGELVPLPLIEPVVKVELADVRADRDGLTALFDLVVGSTDLRAAPHTPERADGGVTLDLGERVAEPEELAVGVSTSLVRLLSGELVKDGVPRIDARDVPGNPLETLHQRENLLRIVPGLSAPEYAADELRARLTLVGPMSAIASDSDENASVRMESDDVELTVDHLPPDGDWQRAAVVRLSLRQPVSAAVRKNGAYRNFIAVADLERTVITPLEAMPVVGDRVDANLAAELVLEGWNRWLIDEGPFSGPLQDFDLPGASLRIEEFASRSPSTGVSGGLLLARFTVPDTSLENRSDLPLTYRIRAEPNGPWGGPFTLVPGDTHTYKTREVLRFEQVGAAPGVATRRTLEIGQCYHYHLPVGALYPVLDSGTEYAPSDDTAVYRKDPRPWRLRAPVAGRESPALSSTTETSDDSEAGRASRGPYAPRSAVTSSPSPGRN